jgi:hypothetical protein
MLRIFYFVVAVICLPCIGYMLMNTVEKEDFFLSRLLAKWLFPKQNVAFRHKKLEFIAGLIVAVLGIAAVVAFLITRFGNKV